MRKADSVVAVRTQLRMEVGLKVRVREERWAGEGMKSGENLVF
jgi:hypothetical protein